LRPKALNILVVPEKFTETAPGFAGSTNVTLVAAEVVDAYVASAALVAVTRHVPALVAVSWPFVIAQPFAVPSVAL
jgi:hypothetical protein